MAGTNVPSAILRDIAMAAAQSTGVQQLRRLVLGYHSAALLLLALTMAARLLVPGGFMPMMTAQGVRVLPCSGWMPASTSPAAGAIGHHAESGVIHGGRSHPAGTPDHLDKSEVPCAFAGLALPSLSGADPLVLALLVAFIVAVGIRVPVGVVRPSVTRPWPPAHAPPATA